MPVNQPLVTVFTLIYNTNPRFVIEAIESIRANNYPNIQHIIIDDCSPNPEPKRVVKEWIDREKYLCEFYEHEMNYGVCKTLNHVLELAKGIYIFGCSDDIILPNKIFTEIQVLENLDSTFAATYSDATLIDEKSDKLYGLFIQKHREFTRLPEGYIYEILLEGNFLPVMSMMWKTQVIRDVGGYDERLKYEDFDLHLRVTKKFKIKLISKELSMYRIHSSSLAHTIPDWRKDHLLIYSKHIESDIARNKISEIIRNVISSSKTFTELKNHNIKFPCFWWLVKRLFFFNSNTLFSMFIHHMNKAGINFTKMYKF